MDVPLVHTLASQAYAIDITLHTRAFQQLELVK